MLTDEWCVADPHYVDTLQFMEDLDSRFTQASCPVPPHWRRSESGGWVVMTHVNTDLPLQGWKIHASATPDSADEVLEKIWSYCVAHELAFKFRRSKAIVEVINGKQADRSASGKFVTLYPVDDKELERTLTNLGSILADIPGPYILNDRRWGSGPLYLRYGGFILHFCFGPDGDIVPALKKPDGTLVPDMRGAAFKVPSWAPIPEFLRDWLQNSDRGSESFPYGVEKVLHFSNAGGVYKATDHRSGQPVLLREARPNAGLDRNGMDAVARLDRQYTQMQRLAGLDFVPAVVAREKFWEHHFLAEEFITGENLYQAVASKNPFLQEDSAPRPEVLTEYTRWACSVLDGVEVAVRALHDQGVVFGDLALANVMIRPDDSVCLIDFEAAIGIDEDLQIPMFTAGFRAPWDLSGFSSDMYALACMRLAVFCPLTFLLRFGPDKHEHLITWVEQRFPLPAGFARRLRHELAPQGADQVTPTRQAGLDTASMKITHTTQLLSDMAVAIRSSATPDRSDRLFPGHPEQFNGQSTALAYGAAGVLHALHVTGLNHYPEFSEHVAWFAAATERSRQPRPGLYDGLGGVACVLDELGHSQHAQDVLGRLRSYDLQGCGIGLFGGLAGVGMTFLYFGDLEQAAVHGEALAHRLNDAAKHTPTAGLMRGWSGPALFFTSLYAKTGDIRYLRLARNALCLELDSCDVTSLGPGLGDGRVGVGIALHEYLSQDEYPRFRGELNHVRAKLESPLLQSSSLFTGHASLLYGSTRFGSSINGQRAQLAALRLHAVRPNGYTAFPMDGSPRLSMDLASGTAGVLLAAYATTSEAEDPPLGLLPLTKVP